MDSRLREAAELVRQGGWLWRGAVQWPPEIVLWHGGGMGDELMISAPAHEIRRRGGERVWVMTKYPELFERNPDVACVVPLHGRLRQLFTVLGGSVKAMHYAWRDPVTDREEAPARHLVAEMCARAEVRGEVALRPWLLLSESERERGRRVPRQIAIQSGSMTAKMPMFTKQWYPERFQEVVDALAPEFNFVQLGSLGDPPLAGALDFRGRTTLRESAAVLSQSRVFVGLVGGLMHMARAVECRGVIVYGGRETPALTGYPANENLAAAPACSPCWQWNRCDFEKRCMQPITSGMVVEAIRRQDAVFGQPLPVASLPLF